METRKSPQRRDVIIDFKDLVGLNYHLLLFKTMRKQKNPVLKKGPNF